MKYIGIRCTYNDFDLRRELLLFDTLALPNFDLTMREWVSGRAGEERRQLAHDFKWLLEKGVVIYPKIDSELQAVAPDDYREWLQKKKQIELDIQKFQRYRVSSGETNIDRLDDLVADIKQTGDFNNPTTFRSD